jgi:hypothetical protein
LSFRAGQNSTDEEPFGRFRIVTDGTWNRRTTVAYVDPWLAIGVSISTAATDAVYVMFNAAVSARRRLPAATWSSIWYLLSAFAVISYTRNWVYVGFAAAGSWMGAYASLTLLHGVEKSRAARPF